MFDSPIEYILYNYMINHPSFRQLGLFPQMQVPIGKYRVDMLIRNCYGYPLCIVECDGKAFHSSDAQKQADEKRGREIRLMTGLPILRFTGSQINNDAWACVDSLIKFLMIGRRTNRKW